MDKGSLPIPEPLGLSLSRRQCQVLRLLLQGRSEKEAARAPGISPHTLHVYVKALYRRFGVHSRGELHAAVRGTDDVATYPAVADRLAHWHALSIGFVRLLASRKARRSLGLR